MNNETPQAGVPPVNILPRRLVAGSGESLRATLNWRFMASE
ncbi:MAG: hypothetical protein ACOX9C_08390 [Kiritimatiellia bacterium]|jgi:hypothetical protein